jgi:hypothetical protein
MLSQFLRLLLQGAVAVDTVTVVVEVQEGY